MHAYTDYVKRRLLLLLAINIYPSLSITVNFHSSVVNNIVATKKLPLMPVNIPCFLTDLVRITAPVINEYGQYYLTRPNGDTTKLDIIAPTYTNTNRTPYGRGIVTSFMGDITVLTQEDAYSAFKEIDFEKNNAVLAENEFIVGPLLEEDYGNWVLSIYTRDINGDWIELFQVLTMSITEYTILDPYHPEVLVGDTLNLSFAFPFPALETCEIMAPRSTFDRFYNRTFTNFNKCAFTIPNITKEDGGTWSIVGFGKIVYQGDAFLTVIQPNTTSTMTERTNTSTTSPS